MKKVMLCLFCLAILVSKNVMADTAYFGLIIGNNTPPTNESGLKKLKYADDDAVRFYRFMTKIGTQSLLFTQLDGASQERYRSIKGNVKIPSVENLIKAIAVLKNKIAKANAAGHETIVYFFYSGHGAFNKSGNPFLALTNGEITRSFLYQEILTPLAATYQHVFIDACYAGGIVGNKGMFDNESEGQNVALNKEQLTLLSGMNQGPQASSVGFVVSASQEKRTHEWSLLESGIFTHQVLSGLYGAADVNFDGIVEYSELSAFVDSANSMVNDARFRLSVVSKAPLDNKSIPIVQLSQMRDVWFLYGAPNKLGHFFIEDASGRRYLDANLTGNTKMHVAVPKKKKMFFHANSKEAEFSLSNGNMHVSQLDFKREQIRSKGSVESAFQKGLFETPFGMAYYLGHVNGQNEFIVDFNAPSFRINSSQAELREKENQKLLKRYTVLSFALGGSLSIAGGVSGIWAIKKKKAFLSAGDYNEAVQLNREYKRLGNASMIFSAMAAALTATGFILLSKYKKKSTKSQKINVYPAINGFLVNAQF